jgi:hypothetical protein
MSDTSIRKLKENEKTTSKELEKSTKIHDKTSSDGAEFANKVGSLRSTLADVNAQLSNERKSQLGKVRNAVDSDDKAAQKSSEAKAKEKQQVDTLSKETATEQTKANKISENDKRYSAKGLKETLKKAKVELDGVSTSHKKTLETSKTSRDNANKRAQKAIRDSEQK